MFIESSRRTVDPEGGRICCDYKLGITEWQNMFRGLVLAKMALRPVLLMSFGSDLHTMSEAIGLGKIDKPELFQPNLEGFGDIHYSELFGRAFEIVNGLLVTEASISRDWIGDVFFGHLDEDFLKKPNIKADLYVGNKVMISFTSGIANNVSNEGVIDSVYNAIMTLS